MRGISRRGAGYLFMVINHAKPGDAGSEKCPELKEARKRANIRSGTIRRGSHNAAAKRAPSFSLSRSITILATLRPSLIPFPPCHSIFSVEQIALRYTSWRFIPVNAIAFVDLSSPSSRSSGNHEKHPFASAFFSALFFKWNYSLLKYYSRSPTPIHRRTH